MIAIIPARGGSKGLPGKNIRLLVGKPLIVYTIQEAKKSKYITRVIVSTDDEEIARISKEHGAGIPFLRPESLASDTAKAIDNYVYTIDRLSKESGEDIKEFVVLQPTSPLRTVEDIDGAIEMYFSKNADSVVSYTKEAHPITWHRYLDDENHFVNIFPESIDNRQVLRESYYPNGAVYVFKTELINSGRYTSENSFCYVMPRNRSIDIDYPEDFQYAEFIINSRFK